MKELFLSKLYEKSLRGEYLSGEEAAVAMHVSRNAVWKMAEELRAEGCAIDASPRRGYRLRAEVPFLTAAAINAHLVRPHPITVLGETDSTNRQILRMAEEGAEEGTIVIAESQTEGRGRLGRQFVSPPGTGIYMSFLLRPKSSAAQAVRITTAAAVAVCDAIEKLVRDKTEIKWVNDIFIEGKKVCGILTEAAFRLEEGTLDYAVLGVGFNAYTPEGGFPPEIASIAGSVYEARREDGRNALAAAFLNGLRGALAEPQEALGDYRRRCLVLGKDILVQSPQGSRPARALDLDEQCGLMVQYPDGSREVLRSGEISVRPVGSTSI